MALDVKPWLHIQIWDQEISLHWTMRRTPLAEGRANQRYCSHLRCPAGLAGSTLSWRGYVLGLASSPAGRESGGLRSHTGNQKFPENSALPSVEQRFSPPICSGIKLALGGITIHGIPEMRTLWKHRPNSQ